MEFVPFKQFPRSARYGVIFLLISWVFLILSQAVLYAKVSFLQMTIGLFCCVIVFTVKNWGRIVCIVYNVILMGSAMYNLFRGAHSEMIFAAVNLMLLILFAIATYYLSIRETAGFYKKYSKRAISDAS